MNDSTQPKQPAEDELAGKATCASAPSRVLVTGASGYIGGQVVRALAEKLEQGEVACLVAADLRPVPETARLPGVVYETLDVRDPAIAALLKLHQVEVVAHLAAIVTPGKKSNRELEHSVDVLGTQNVVQGCLEAGVQKIIVTSSGAAYGYHADSPAWLHEDDPLRGNQSFAYSDHKRQVEELLAVARKDHPELAQLILRPGTVLGEGTRNQITDLFDRRFVMGLRGADTPFVFIWDQDVAQIVVRGALGPAIGAYNLAGDGSLPLRELAAMMDKPYVALPVGLVRSALRVLKLTGLTQYGPEQVDFLRYRPVLANERLKQVFPYIPRKSSREVFELFLRSRRSRRSRRGARQVERGARQVERGATTEEAAPLSSRPLP